MLPTCQRIGLYPLICVLFVLHIHYHHLLGKLTSQHLLLLVLPKKQQNVSRKRKLRSWRPIKLHLGELTCEVHSTGCSNKFWTWIYQKIVKCYEKRKNSWKFVYILAKQCRSHFNLTNIFDKKFQNSNFAQIWDFH